MRQPDLNRLKRAVDHIKAAKTHLGSIQKYNIYHDIETRLLDYIQRCDDLMFYIDNMIKQEENIY